jgi:hypothetical protein
VLLTTRISESKSKPSASEAEKADALSKTRPQPQCVHRAQQFNTSTFRSFGYHMLALKSSTLFLLKIFVELVAGIADGLSPPHHPARLPA